MSRVVYVGHFAEGKNINDGQTVKTRTVYRTLTELGIEVKKIDTNNRKTIIPNIIKTCRKGDAVIYSLSRRGYRIVTPILAFYKKLLGIKIINIVIGGSFSNFLVENRFYRNLSKKQDKILVETEGMKAQLENVGLKNVEVLPNYKYLEKEKRQTKKDGKIRLFTFSRVIKEKGIIDAIDAVKIANEKGTKATLDIYGKISQDFEAEFNEKIAQNSEFVKYKGEEKPENGAKIAAKYDGMIFLSFWPGEGMPGTLIDAMFGGCPVIATKWGRNEEIIFDGQNGYTVPIHSPELAAERILEIEKKELNNICYLESEKYSPNQAKKMLADKMGLK